MGGQEEQHYQDDDGSHIQYGQTRGVTSKYGDDEDEGEDEGTLGRLYDSTVHRPCQALGGYCGTEAIENMTLCHPNKMHFLSVFRTYHHHPHRHHQEEEITTPYIYSPSAPIGPSSCEYCGQTNTEDCTSNLPLDSYDKNGSYGQQRSTSPAAGAVAVAVVAGATTINNELTTSPKASTTAASSTLSTSTTDAATIPTCPRPKLFFLKKKPPFATPEGWNPQTEYRNTLHEPPTSSMEARMAAWDEVRGAVGRGVNGNKGSSSSYHVGSNSNSNNNTNNSNTGSGAGHGHGHGGGYGESEVSFSSDGGGGGSGGGGQHVTSSDRDGHERSLSPVTWVSGLLEKF